MQFQGKCNGIYSFKFHSDCSMCSKIIMKVEFWPNVRVLYTTVDTEYIVHSSDTVI